MLKRLNRSRDLKSFNLSILYLIEFSKSQCAKVRISPIKGIGEKILKPSITGLLPFLML